MSGKGVAPGLRQSTKCPENAMNNRLGVMNARLSEGRMIKRPENGLKSGIKIIFGYNLCKIW
jgi:hypothetical protein